MENSIISARDKVLVTGSNGFIGASVVECLLQHGVSNIRCFVRASNRMERLQTVLKKYPDANVELTRGDLLSREDCKAAVRGVSVIIHLAAGSEKTFLGAFMSSVMSTRNLLDAFLEHGDPRRFVHVSSFSVYSNLKLKRGALLDERSPLEDDPHERHDAYGFGKLKQEQVVREYGQKRSLPYVIVRPGAVFGPGKSELSGRVGMQIRGLFIHVGASNQLPLTYVDNCAEAIVLAGLTGGVDEEVFNVVDNDLPTSRQFLRAYRGHKRLLRVPVPYPAVYSFCALCEWVSRFFKPLQRFNRRRCAADWKGNRFSNRKLCERLGWTPRVSMNQAMEKFLAQFDHETAQAKPGTQPELSTLRTVTGETT